MRSRIAVAITSAVLYAALAYMGNAQFRAHYDGIERLARHGISIDTYWWTPVPLGLARGLNLPAVLVGFAGWSVLAPVPTNERTQTAVELSITPIVAAFWFLVIGGWQHLEWRIHSDDALKRVAIRVAFPLAAMLLALFLWWGLRERFPGVVPLASARSFKAAIEVGPVLVRAFALCWLAAGGFSLAMAFVLRSRNRQSS